MTKAGSRLINSAKQAAAIARGDDAEARAAKLEAVLGHLVAKLDECKPHIDGVFSFFALHGNNYSGPNYADELAAAREVLSRSRLALSESKP